MKVSVVIPCRNEVKHIEDCVDSIQQAIRFADIEGKIFIVDGKSDDGTLDVIRQLTEKYPNVRLVVNEQQLTPYAFNLGIKADLDFDFLVIAGSRHILSENYIKDGINTLVSQPEIWCVGGTVNNTFLNQTGKVVASVMSTALGMGLGNFRTMKESGFVDTIGTPVYPRFVFDKIGFFDEELIRNQDDEYNFRVLKAGGKIYHNHHISVEYFVRGSYKGLWRQFFQYGYWKVYVNQKHRTFTTIRQLIPPLFVLYLILFLFSWLFGATVGLTGSFPLIVYLALTAITSNRLVQEDNELRFWDVFKTFPILHISYGLGYLKGVIDFVLLNKKPSDKQKQLSR